MIQSTDWFRSMYSNDELAQILSDMSKDVLGFRVQLERAQRCTLVAELESLEAFAG